MLRIAFDVVCAATFLVTIAFLARPDWYRRYRRHIRPDELEFENPRRDSQQVIAMLIVAGIALSMLIGSIFH